MSRDKEINIRNENNERIMNRIKEVCPGVYFEELKMIPRISGYIIWGGFQDMDTYSRISWLDNQLGNLGKLPSMLWCLTPIEWEYRLEVEDMDEDDD